MAWTLKPESEWEYIEVEPIVTPALWDQCNALLSDLGGKRKRPTKRAATLFSGLTFCHCGQKMYLPGNSVKYTCQKCRNKLAADDLEEVYVSELRNFFTSRPQIEKALSQANETLSKLDENLQGKIQESQKVQLEREAVYRAYVDQQITVDQFGERYRPLDERKKQLEDEVLRIQADIAFQKVNNVSADQILEEASTLYGRWGNLDKDAKRSVIESITDNIVVGVGEVTVNLIHIRSAEELTKGQRNLRGSWRRRA
jgi:site-specific DNA recombinase